MRRAGRIALALTIAAAGCACLLVRTAAQNDSQQTVEEVIVNQAAGRVVMAVVKHAILIATAENPIEPGTRPPIPIAVSSMRAGAVLGADEWVSPSLEKQLGRLDQELPHLNSPVGGVEAPTLGGAGANTEASDIESIGKAVRERLSELAGNIHNRVEWPANLPVADLVLADYAANYGPEVWQLTYSLEQQQQHGDYWVTNIDGPVYLQIWPPEKGQARTLMEFDFPPKDGPPALLDLLKQKDPRLETVLQGDRTMANTANEFLTGDSLKISATDATEFLRAAMAAVTPANLPQSMAIIRDENGFDWVLRPPAEPKPAQPTRPTGAPSLAHPGGEDSQPAPSLAHPPGSP